MDGRLSQLGLNQISLHEQKKQRKAICELAAKANFNLLSAFQTSEAAVTHPVPMDGQSGSPFIMSDLLSSSQCGPKTTSAVLSTCEFLIHKIPLEGATQCMQR